MADPIGELRVGGELDHETQDRTGQPIIIDSDDLTTHGVIVGMTGSGKTGLGVVLLEEALLSGIPVLAIDPKGDLGNLALTFPDLQANDFEPWMDEGKARVESTTVADLAQGTAELWTKGLASWDLTGEDVGRLQKAANPIIYTPGATHGIAVDVLGRLTRPATDDREVLQDEADSTVSGLLGLVGIESDPLSGREHILLANLIMRAWEQNEPLDMARLLGQIIDPPMRKLGVLELETFYPAKDRQKLLLKLNGLLASPTFSTWSEGVPLDIGSMLWDSEGNARAAVVALNHLSDSERQFAITLLLSKLISWMRTQSGTGELRALVYIDEVAGLAPPIGNPPTKKPILTLLKQARAFGVGLVLSTQNPVDLDYKAISNAGTWMIGRLQTEQDKKRLVDGLRSAEGTTDIEQVEATISGLDKRQFMLRSARSSDLQLFTTRWAMSYLAGPLTNQQVDVLMSPRRAELLSSGTTENSPVDSATSEQPETGSQTSTSTPSADSVKLADDETAVAPEVAPKVPVRYVTAGAPWLDQLGASGSQRMVAYLAARVDLLFDESRADLAHRETWEAIIPLNADGADLDGHITVDFDDRDFVADPPNDNIRYVLPPADLSATDVRSIKTNLKTMLHGDETMQLWRNQELKLWSRPDETKEQFELRCDAAAQDKADEETAAIRTKLEKKRDSIELALAKAEDRVNELEAQQSANRNSKLLKVGASILGGLLGGRGTTRSLASAARGLSSGRSANTGARLDSSRRRVGEKVDQLEDLETDLAEALVEIDEEWTTIAAQVENVEVGLEKNDVTIEDLHVVWIPMASS